MRRQPEPAARSRFAAGGRELAWRAVVALLLPALVACGAAAGVSERPTPQPVLNITPAPTQDILGTQTAFAQRIVPTPTPLGLYIVKAGDTLNTIADSFQTTVDEIIALNNIADPNQIEVGQQLIIPSLLTPTASSAESPASAP